MKLFAVQSVPGDYSIDTLASAKSSIGGAYIHRCADGDPYLLVCNAPSGALASAWLAANGWIILPNPKDFGTSIGATIAGLLVSHAPTVVATDTCPAAMQKVVTNTGMSCFSPY